MNLISMLRIVNCFLKYLMLSKSFKLNICFRTILFNKFDAELFIEYDIEAFYSFK